MKIGYLNAVTLVELVTQCMVGVTHKSSCLS